MKKPTFKRIFAFIIDILIVSIISSSLSSIRYINPSIDKYEESYNEYTEYLNSTFDSQNTKDILNSEKYQSVTYNLNYNGRYSSIITLVVTFLYFVVFQYTTKGFTLGKRLFKIKVKAKNGKLKFKNLILRSLIINSLVTTLLNVVFIFILSKQQYLNISIYLEILEMGLLFTTFAMILYRKDGRGLHDLIADTSVVYSKEEE